MKIQLDTTQKVIKIEEAVKFSELIETLERLLPNGGWKEFKLETQTQINWTSNPIIIERTPYVPNPWWQQPWITYGTNSADFNIEPKDYSLNSGVYNIEL